MMSKNGKCGNRMCLFVEKVVKKMPSMRDGKITPLCFGCKKHAKCILLR